jgi:cell division protein ZapE
MDSWLILPMPCWRKVRLICSAADTPERLYIEGEGSFEFARTASRLREMQATGWGQNTLAKP